MIVLRLAVLIPAIGLFTAAASQAGEEQLLRMRSIPEWQILHKVDPEYPAAALRNRIQGTVLFAAVIGKDGRIERLRLVSGHPLLRRAAQEAVQQWVYRPQSLAGKPVRVSTEISVRFQLDPYRRPVKPDSKSAPPTVLSAALMRGEETNLMSEVSAASVTGGFRRTVFTSALILAAAAWPIPGTLLGFAGDKVVEAQTASRMDAVAITKVTYREMPIHCRIILSRSALDTVEPFQADDDWLKDLTIYILNRTDKTIVYGSVRLRFPETGDGSFQHPVAVYNMPFGRLPDSVAFNRRTGLPLQQDPTRAPAAFYPGQTMAIHVADYAEEIKHAVEEFRTPLANVTRCIIDLESFVFSDGLRWAGGGYSVPDAEHPGNYKMIRDRDYFPGKATWPPGLHN